VITALSYIGFRSPHAADWAMFGPQVLGAQLAGSVADGTVRLRVDEAEARITIEPGEREELAHLGWDVGSAAGLEAARDRIAAAGVDVVDDASAADARRVAALATFVDPFGFRHELTYGLARGGPFVPGRPISGFVTGEGGLGHVVLVVPDVVAGRRFYCDVLGFKVSDTVDAGALITFMHCNPRHHSLAIAGGRGLVGLHHLMLEVGSLDDVGTALDIAVERNLPLAMGLGRHTNDLMTSFYVRTPSGFEIEYGTGGRLIDDATWTIGSYTAQSLWGHRAPAAGAPRPQLISRFQPAHSPS
jgi:2,3-dihydroxybiphenyl 1,2-dioxygenase